MPLLNEDFIVDLDTSGAKQNVIGRMTLSWIRYKWSKQNQMLFLI